MMSLNYPIKHNLFATVYVCPGFGDHVKLPGSPSPGHSIQCAEKAYAEIR